MKKVFEIKYIWEYLLIAAGALLAVFPDIISWIFYIAGAVIILWNIIKFIVLTVRKEPCSIALTIFAVVIGIIVITLPKTLSIGIPIIIGLFILINGIERIISALQYKKTGYHWYISAAAGAIFTIVGIILLANPSEVTETVSRLLGFGIVILGVYRLIAAINLNKFRMENPDKVIDIKDYRVDD